MANGKSDALEPAANAHQQLPAGASPLRQCRLRATARRTLFTAPCSFWSRRAFVFEARLASIAKETPARVPGSMILLPSAMLSGPAFPGSTQLRRPARGGWRLAWHFPETPLPPPPPLLAPPTRHFSGHFCRRRGTACPTNSRPARLRARPRACPSASAEWAARTYLVVTADMADMADMADAATATATAEGDAIQGAADTTDAADTASSAAAAADGDGGDDGGDDAESGDEGKEVVCRICFDGPTPDVPDNAMLSPSQCSGSMAHCHRQCLDEWRMASFEVSGGRRQGVGGRRRNGRLTPPLPAPRHDSTRHPPPATRHPPPTTHHPPPTTRHTCRSRPSHTALYATLSSRSLLPRRRM